VKEFSKSVKNWESNCHEFGVLLFWGHSVYNISFIFMHIRVESWKLDRRCPSVVLITSTPAQHGEDWSHLVHDTPLIQQLNIVVGAGSRYPHWPWLNTRQRVNWLVSSTDSEAVTSHFRDQPFGLLQLCLRRSAKPYDSAATTCLLHGGQADSWPEAMWHQYCVCYACCVL